MEVKTEPQQFQWIINEGLLRDEGTLFGIAGAPVGEKIDAIHDYYRVKKAAEQTKREQLEKRFAGVIAGSQTFSPDRDKRGNVINLVPVTLQALLYGGICYFNFFLELYWLSPILHSTVICIGLYLFGLFSVFFGRSVMYNGARSLTGEEVDSEHRERWKIYLEEFGVPLVVSLFVAVLAGGSYPWYFSVMAALFFFLLFLLGGKGLVNTFFRLRGEAGRYYRRYKERKKIKMQIAESETMRRELGGALAALAELDGEEAYKIHIFTSEYKLALESRQLATNASLKSIL